MESHDRQGPQTSDSQSEGRHDDSATGDSKEPRGIEKDIAKADKKARTGATEEQVRNTRPAGAWNDTASD